MSEREVVVEKLEMPIIFTGHHPHHYKAFYKDDPEHYRLGMTANEAKLFLINGQL